MDEAHLAAALRYVALNPVRLAERPTDWRWSSIHALLGPEPGDGLTTTGPVLLRYPNFAELIEAGEDEILSRSLRRAEVIGRPVGTAGSMAQLESEVGRTLSPGKRRRKPEISALSP